MKRARLLRRRAFLPKPEAWSPEPGLRVGWMDPGRRSDQQRRARPGQAAVAGIAGAGGQPEPTFLTSHRAGLAAQVATVGGLQAVGNAVGATRRSGAGRTLAREPVGLTGGRSADTRGGVAAVPVVRASARARRAARSRDPSIRADPIAGVRVADPDAYLIDLQSAGGNAVPHEQSGAPASPCPTRHLAAGPPRPVGVGFFHGAAGANQRREDQAGYGFGWVWHHGSSGLIPEIIRLHS